MKEHEPSMSATLEQSRTQQLRAAAEHAPEESREDVDRLLHVFYRHTATEDLLAREPEDLLGAALAERDLARRRAVGTANVDVTNPTVESQGWSSGHTIVQVVTDDMPFLVDSVTAALDSLGRTVHLIVHPQLVVRRDAVGTLEEIYADTPAERRVRRRHRVVDAPRDRPRGLGGGPRGDAAAAHVLGNVRDAVEDWRKMRERCTQHRGLAHDSPPAGIPPAGGRHHGPVPRVAGRQQLHLPRLPRVLPRRRRPGREHALSRERHRPRHPALRPAGVASRSPG